MLPGGRFSNRHSLPSLDQLTHHHVEPHSSFEGPTDSRQQPVESRAARSPTVTRYVLAGQEVGSKLDRARTLDIPVIDAAEFERMAGVE